jgi:DNA-binding transcriptional ArsR family regulator
MSHTTDEGDHGGLSPDAAFSVLGDETRLRILRTLGDATDLLSFSELRERLGRPDSGQFNYQAVKRSCNAARWRTR